MNTRHLGICPVKGPKLSIERVVECLHYIDTELRDGEWNSNFEKSDRADMFETIELMIKFYTKKLEESRDFAKMCDT
jgi:hypothetical protein